MAVRTLADVLRKGRHQRVPRSHLFPGLDLKLLLSFLNRPSAFDAIRAFRDMVRDYQADGSRQATHNSLDRILIWSFLRRKLDYLWYAPAPGGPSAQGFLAPARVSEHFGSDHRAVWATAAVPPADPTDRTDR